MSIVDWNIELNNKLYEFTNLSENTYKYIINFIIIKIKYRYSIDNGAMIAWPGLLAFKAKQKYTLDDTEVTQRFRTDDVFITWRDN